MSSADSRNAEGVTRRCFVINTTAMLVGLTIGTHATGQQPPLKAYEFINGQWFDGDQFRSKKFYSVNGILTTKKPVSVASVIDLNGKYVSPPFGEAHNHNLVWSDEAGFTKLKGKYLRDGIFYVKNPTNLPRAVADSSQG